jgi:hypothetical protein
MIIEVYIYIYFFFSSQNKALWSYLSYSALGLRADVRDTVFPSFPSKVESQDDGSYCDSQGHGVSDLFLK